MDFDDRSLTIKEVSKFLNISTQMVHILIKDGRLKAFKIGSAIRILYSDMMSFVNLQKEEYHNENIGYINREKDVFTVKDLSLNIKDFLIRNISFKIPRGKVICVLGPSGSGKSTLLRGIAGLIEINSGRIFNGLKRLDEKSTQDRELGFVFEDYALFENLNTYNNIGFPLKAKRKSGKFINEQVLNITKELGINTEYLEKYITELPEGIKQLVSIGKERIHDFDLLLMDEPLSRLDINIKKSVIVLLKKLVTKFNKTTIITLNDPDSAMILGDYILILNNGEIIQFGESLSVYNKPVNSLSMELTSRYGINKLNINVKNNRIKEFTYNEIPEDGSYIVYFRPDNVQISKNGITVQITEKDFYDNNKSLCTCITEEKQEIKLLLPNNTEERLSFVPLNPLFVKQ